MTTESAAGSRIIVIGGYVLEGPFDSPLELQDRPGVYVILDFRENAYGIIDIGESSAVMSRVKDHNRKDCWIQKCKGTLKIAVHYSTPAQSMWRQQLKYDLGKYFIPPCQGEE